jgi:glycosyltransferase involved in cell wall biosynthesis
MPNPFVLHIAKWYPNEDDDLEGIFIKRHIEATQPHYNSVVFYARASSKKISGLFYETKIEQSGANVTCIGYYKSKITGLRLLDRLIKTGLYYIVMTHFLKWLLHNMGKPVLIHAHVLLRSCVIAYIFSRKLKIRYLVTEHSTFYTSHLKTPVFSVKNRIRKFLIKRAEAVITVSEDLERGMKRFRLYNDNYIRVFNCIDTHLFYFKPKSESGIVQLLHVSEFKNEHKNVLGILEAIQILIKKQAPILFHLVGYGTDLDKIMDFIKSNQLEKQVIYHGKLTNIELASLYQTADAFILFSNKENMPCVIEESLCCGTPVISSSVGGIPEVVTIDNGLLVQKGNKDELVEAIQSILRKSVYFDLVKISNDAIQLFSFESIGNKLYRIYKTFTINN